MSDFTQTVKRATEFLDQRPSSVFGDSLVVHCCSLKIEVSSSYKYYSLISFNRIISYIYLFSLTNQPYLGIMLSCASQTCNYFFINLKLCK